MQKFEMPITAPLGVREQKNFGFPSFSLGGTSTPKMIKIGELGVLSYLDLPWSEPKAARDRKAASRVATIPDPVPSRPVDNPRDGTGFFKWHF